MSVLIETPGAVHDAWAIAALPGIVSLDFGLMDFVSAHHGAIPVSAMVSPGQFEHPLVRRAKCEIAAAALAHGVVPAHNVTRALDNPATAFADARRARDEFGFLRMWSIHPSQIDPIVDAMRPDAPEVEKAQAILAAAQDARVGTAAHRRRAARPRVVPAGVDDCCSARMPRASRSTPRAAAYFRRPPPHRDNRPLRKPSMRLHSCSS